MAAGHRPPTSEVGICATAFLANARGGRGAHELAMTAHYTPIICNTRGATCEKVANVKCTTANTHVRATCSSLSKQPCHAHATYSAVLHEIKQRELPTERALCHYQCSEKGGRLSTSTRAKSELYGARTSRSVGAEAVCPLKPTRRAGSRGL